MAIVYALMARLFIAYLVAVGIGTGVATRTDNTDAGIAAGIGAVLVFTLVFLTRGFRVLGEVEARTHSQGRTVPDWTADPSQPRSYVVNQPDPHFDARVRHVFGPWYSLKIINTATGAPIPRAAKRVPLTGRSSVNRAVKYGILRFYAEHEKQG